MEKLLSSDFYSPLIYFTILRFCDMRLYPLSEIPFKVLFHKYNFALVFGRITCNLAPKIAIVYICVNILNGNYFLPILVFIFSRILSIILSGILTKMRVITLWSTQVHPVMMSVYGLIGIVVLIIIVFKFIFVGSVVFSILLLLVIWAIILLERKITNKFFP